jgi:hypothetical protein
MLQYRVRSGRLLRAPALALLCAAGCNQLLGIEEAAVDPRLEGTAGSQAQGTGGMAGSAAETGGTAATSGGSSGSAGSDVAPEAGNGMGGEAGASINPTGGSSGSSGSSSGKSGSGGVVGDAGESGSGGEAGAPGPVDLCPEYCDEIMAQCDGSDAQYLDRAQCEKVCGLFPQGTIGAANADTVACRLKYAQKTRYGSESEISVYCRQAGPGGDGACGGNCESFCTLMMSVCTETSAGPYHFANINQCEASCAALPASTVTYSTSNPLVADGDHVQCRLFHVTSAAMADADEHCSHSMGLTLCEETPGNGN